ncbi:MAG: IclR family transcriptional regulator [Pseudomonadota bacterium]
MKESDNSKSPAPALTRALAVLEALAQDPYEMNQAELAEKLDIPPASLWRILKVLTDGEYLILDRKRHTYRFGFKLMRLGSAMLNEGHFRSQGREFLRKLSDQTGETAELDVRIRDQLVLIDQVVGANAVYLYSHIGSTMPYFHATAPGKVFLSRMERTKLHRVMNKIGFPRLTPHTIQDLEALERELARVAAAGYAIDVEEMREGVGRAAAPVMDDHDRIVGVIAIACPAFRLREPGLALEYGRLVKEAADEMSTARGAV